MRSVEGDLRIIRRKEFLQDIAIKIEYLTAYLKVHPDSKEITPNVEFTKEFLIKLRILMKCSLKKAKLFC